MNTPVTTVDVTGCDGAETDMRRRVLELLLACIRHYFKHPEWTHVDGRTQDMDWDRVLYRAQSLKLLPYLYHAASTSAVLQPPPRIAETLERFCAANRLHNLYLLRATYRTVTFLARHGIQAVPFKGPLLAKMLYDDLSMRSSGDIDLVVPKSDFERATRLLSANGYRSEFNNRQQRRYRQAHLVHDDGHVIDLHWSIASDVVNLNGADDLLQRSLHPLTVQSMVFTTYGPVMTLNILCLHAAKERWRELGRACEIAQFLHRYPELSWTELRETAEKLGTVRPLLLGVKFAREVTGCRIPPQAAREIDADPVLEKLEQRAWHQLHHEEAAPALLDSKHEFYDLLSDSSLHRLKLLARNVPRYARIVCRVTDADRALVRLPRGLHFLYVPLRPLRLALVYGKRALSGVLKNT